MQILVPTLNVAFAYFSVLIATTLKTFLNKILFISDAKVIKLNVYRLRDSSLGFYHTGLEFDNREYTYCCGIGKTV